MKRQFLCQFSKTGKFNFENVCRCNFFIWHIFAAGLQIEFFSFRLFLVFLWWKKLWVENWKFSLCMLIYNALEWSTFARKHLFLKQWKMKFDCSTNEISNGNIYLQIDCIEGFSSRVGIKVNSKVIEFLFKT